MTLHTHPLFTIPLRLWAILLAATAPAVLATSASKHKGQCSEVSFKLPVSYQAKLYTAPPDPGNETAIVDFIRTSMSGNPAPPISGTKLVSETYTIHAVYCKPHLAARKRYPRRGDALQLLVHGITYNKDMWAGFGLGGEQYDWHSAANAEGYHTLAIDRLGHGPGARMAAARAKGTGFLDPLMLQGYLHAESLHQLIKTVRGNTRRNVLGRGFGKIIFVGHSYGSYLGTYLASIDPSSISALVLTGYSNTLNPATPHVLTFRSAALLPPYPSSPFQPAFPPSQPLGYVTTADPSDRQYAFFSSPDVSPPTYDPTIIPVDFARQDTVTTGEAATMVDIAAVPAAGYSGPVIVVTGDEDFIFCEKVDGGRTCGEVLAETLRVMFPDVPGDGEAGRKEYYVAQGAGHCLTLYYSAGETLDAVGEFLGRWF